ncbi:MAG: exopolygalacturonase [Prevotella sp.]|nr:exopolygalacturonase [Prevotella sp.]
MRTIGIMIGLLLATMGAEADNWSDGSRMDDWFLQSGKVDVAQLGRQYVITDYGVSTDSTLVQTTLIQHVIDLCADKGGGVVVIPEGTFLSGALFFPQGTHLHVIGRLKGSDRIADFPVMLTRIEGETCKYFPALVNAYEVDGFTITGHGTIDGNGLRYWQDFWLRRQWNPACTNKDSQRPRLTYIANSKHVTIQDVHLVNSPFWTNHVYKSHHIRFIDCYIYAPTEGVWEQDAAKGAPSSDAIDIDACTDVVVRGCYMHVNDDAVVLKGGKGTWADMDITNGDNQRILIEECTYGRVHGCLTLGSESLHNRNIILRRCKTTNADRVLWLKMRPDTPQHYEYITVENITGHCGRFLFVHPWTQFYKPEKRDDMPLSQCNHIVMRNIQVETPVMLDVEPSDKYKLTDFWLEGQQVY